jgi:hypothetical protein
VRVCVGEGREGGNGKGIKGWWEAQRHKRRRRGERKVTGVHTCARGGGLVVDVRYTTTHTAPWYVKVAKVKKNKYALLPFLVSVFFVSCVYILRDDGFHALHTHIYTHTYSSKEDIVSFCLLARWALAVPSVTAK